MKKAETNLPPLFMNNEWWAQSLINTADNGNCVLNEENYILFLESRGFHKLRLVNSVQYIRVQNGKVEEADPQYITNYVTQFLLDYGSKKTRDYFKQNNIFVSHKFANKLRERIPYDVCEDDEIFLLREGILIVNEEEMYMDPREQEQ